MLEERLAQQDRAARPLGQRIDQAKAQLNKAVMRCEKAEADVRAANETYEQARREVQVTHAKLATFLKETADPAADPGGCAA
eukprot:11179083-Lingulodinium_polyedra.AAC.1